MREHHPALSRLLEEVDATALMEHMRHLASLTRTPGSDDEKQAFSYIHAALSSFGLMPNSFTLPAFISMPVNAVLQVGEKNIPCTTHSMLPNGNCTAEIISIPNADDIPGSGTAGKILMTDGLAMAPVLSAAQKENAAGVIFVAGSHQYHEMIVSTVWGSPAPQDMDSYLGIPAVTICHADGERLKTTLRPGEKAFMHTQVESCWMPIPFLTADIGDVSQNYLLLTGHVDSWHKGAMDNASGNAAVIEISRILVNNLEKLRRGVRVVFWSGHSHGRYAGSAAYCDAYFQDLHDHAFLHITVDCLGAKGATLVTQAACMAETKDLGDFAVRAVTGLALEGTRFGRSCDQSFWGTGTPSLFSSVSEQRKSAVEDAASKAFSLMFGGGKSGGYGWWWHTEADTADKICPDFLKRDTQIFLAAIYKGCSDPVIPIAIHKAFAAFDAQIHSYAKQAKGLAPFEPVLAKTAELRTLLARLDLSTKESTLANACIMQFEQKLLPLVYVKGKIFEHDPASRQSPIPLLEELHLFLETHDPHQRNTLRVLLQRRLNELTYRIGELVALVKDW